MVSDDPLRATFGVPWRPSNPPCSKAVPTLLRELENTSTPGGGADFRRPAMGPNGDDRSPRSNVILRGLKVRGALVPHRTCGEVDLGVVPETGLGPPGASNLCGCAKLRVGYVDYSRSASSRRRSGEHSLAITPIGPAVPSSEVLAFHANQYQVRAPSAPQHLSDRPPSSSRVASTTPWSPRGAFSDDLKCKGRGSVSKRTPPPPGGGRGVAPHQQVAPGRNGTVSSHPR